jgi:hypothetical protein
MMDQSRLVAISRLRSRRPERCAHLQKTVHHAVGADVAGRNARNFQPLGVRLRFIAQRVVFGGDDQRRRQTERSSA